jgi:hypothetical protein
MHLAPFKIDIPKSPPGFIGIKHTQKFYTTYFWRILRLGEKLAVDITKLILLPRK